ncbi:class I SAM-dependent methyltransferase [Aliidiomarina celeris]|uniref:class I SAM-dependent methyltransferase n=1 Tax=Aliidiomarina celeris TaxID=2249428 RepID=UPI000DE8FB47|nr:class I SAM-dependent methyltransferase [Aliidiomarina celeris]
MNHWSQFWNASNTLSSFAEGRDAAGYSGDVKEFWEKSVAGLAENAVIVDIGTGNGALAVLINNINKEQKQQWQVHGVDAADISPAELEKREPAFKGQFDGIQFHGNTDMTAMPFENESVDLVVSQFAFEYAEQAAVLKEVLRVLKPGGRVVMMMHHKKSELYKQTALGLSILRDMVTGSPLFPQTELYLRYASDALQHISLEEFLRTPEGRGTGKTVQWLIEHFLQKYNKDEERVWFDDVAKRIIDISASAKTSEASKQLLKHLITQYSLFSGHILRLEDMVKAANTEGQMKKLVTAAEKAGAEGSFNAFEDDGKLFAWSAELKKA